MITLFLQLHIAGTLVFIFYGVVALTMLVRGKGNAQFMRKSALLIGGHQVITGAALGVLSPNMTVLAVCLRGLFLVSVLYVLSFAVSRRLAYAPQTTS